MGRRQTLADRAKAVVRQLTNEQRGLKARLAHAAKIPASSMSRIASDDPQPVTLAVLDALEELTGRSALQLLADPDDQYLVVTGPQRELLRYCSEPLMPVPVFKALVTLLAWHADETPHERAQRNLHAYARRLTEPQLHRLSAYALAIAEGLLPDLEEAPALPPEGSGQWPTGHRPAKRATTTKR